MMKISTISKLTGCTVETIRYYEQQGLITGAARNEANYRIYQTVHLERVQFIRHCRSLDLTLDEIRLLLSFKDAPDQLCDGVNTLIAQQLIKVNHQIKGLTTLKQQLQTLSKQCQTVHQSADCGILHALSEPQ